MTARSYGTVVQARHSINAAIKCSLECEGVRDVHWATRLVIHSRSVMRMDSVWSINTLVCMVKEQEGAHRLC